MPDEGAERRKAAAHASDARANLEPHERYEELVRERKHHMDLLARWREREAALIAANASAHARLVHERSEHHAAKARWDAKAAARTRLIESATEQLSSERNFSARMKTERNALIESKLDAEQRYLELQYQQFRRTANTMYSRDREEGIADASTLAIVQWTHTLRMKPMLLAARRQILQHRPLAEHHVVLASCGLDSNPCADLLDAARPLTENVTCVTSSGIAAELGSFDAVNSVFHENKNHHDYRTGTARWCWESCDGPYIHWYATTGHALKHVRFFWFLEWDVVWTGNIVTILDAFRGNMKTSTDPSVDQANPTMKSHLSASQLAARLAKPDPPDLLCPNPSKVTSRWTHRTKRDREGIHLNITFKCVTEVYRVSRRLLDTMAFFSRIRRHAMFCEMRAPTVCGMQPWCRMRSLFDEEHTHLFNVSTHGYDGHRGNNSRIAPALEKAGINVSVYNARGFWVMSYLHDGGIPDEAFTNLNEPKLYHAYKWNDSVPLDGRELTYNAEATGLGAALRRAGQLAV